VLDVVGRMAHQISSSTPNFRPRCKECPAGRSDSDDAPTTPCAMCEPGRFSIGSTSAACAGTCEVGSTVWKTGATSVSDCSKCATGQYGTMADTLVCPDEYILCEGCKGTRPRLYLVSLVTIVSRLSLIVSQLPLTFSEIPI
jgi:hypothetical protein